jgi:dienelactone hydrolase
VSAPPRLALALLALLLLLGLPSPAGATGGAPNIAIRGKSFVDGAGKQFRPLGVNLSSAEFTCVEPTYGNDFRRSTGVWALPTDDPAIAAMASWHMNAVRIPLNEDCWLGINPVRRTEDSISRVQGRAAARKAGRALAKRYRRQIVAVVNRIHAHGMVVLLDLHWNAPGGILASQQYPLPDRSHSPAFWRSVARTFKKDHSVVLELFNEPILQPKSALRWRCMRDGCRVPKGCGDCGAKPHGTYRTAGFQQLVNTVRKAGGHMPLLVPGRYYSNDLGQWLRWKPHDRLKQIGATFHAYNLDCKDEGCWDRNVKRVAQKVPVVATEFGPDESDADPCDTSYDQRWMNWADGAGVGYLAWWWFTPDPGQPRCSLDMLADFAGTPREGHGQAVHDHLGELFAGGGSGGGGGGGGSASSVPPDPIPFSKNQVFTLDSPQGTYWVYVPDAYDESHATPIKLLVWLHGCGGESSGDIYTVSPGGDQSYVAITVGGREKDCWNVEEDQSKVLAAIADLKRHFNIDPHRVVLGGYSSGGDLAYRLAFYNASQFAGVLAENTSPFRDTGSSQADSLAAASWKFNVVHLAHTEDETYPIDGVRQETDAMKDAGFPLTRIERPGTHYDADAGDTGTDHDLRVILLPHMNDDWRSP